MNEQRLIIENQYFPCVAWMTVAYNAGSVWLDGAENYNKRSLRNKTLLSQSANQVALSIPLKKGKHNKQSIQQVELSFVEHWQKNHVRAIQSIYGKSPYFIHYFDDITNLIKSSDRRLFNFNKRITKTIIQLLDLDVTVNEQSEFVKISSSNELVLRDMFKYSGAYTAFEQEIELLIRKLDGSTHLPFPISPRSSILDLLFHLGPETRLFLSHICAELKVRR